MSNKKKYFLIKYIFKFTRYDSRKEIYLCKNEEKAIQKINEIINRINNKIKEICDYYNEKYYFEDIYYCKKKITSIEKFKLASVFYYHDDYDEAEFFEYKIKLTEVFNNDGIITIHK